MYRAPRAKISFLSCSAVVNVKKGTAFVQCKLMRSFLRNTSSAIGHLLRCSMLSSASPPHPNQHLLCSLSRCWNRLAVHHLFHIVLKTAAATRGGTREESFIKFLWALLAIHSGGPGMSPETDRADGPGAPSSIHLFSLSRTCSLASGLDMCLRLRLAGYQIIKVCDAKAYHIGFGSHEKKNHKKCDPKFRF